MTTSNAITMDHIKSFFSLKKEVPHIKVAPTATGGLGIDNLEQFPPPKPFVKTRVETEYSKKFIQEDKLEQNSLGRQALHLPGSSSTNIGEMDDIEELSTLAGDMPMPSDMDSEATQQLYATYYKKTVKYDSCLPITSYKDQIIKLLNINPVIIIQGATGCGKTTQVPQFILDYHASKNMFCNIIVTQPRKLAATSIARRVCEERKWQMGTLVGYQVAMDNKTSVDTRLSYVTTGTLLEKLVHKKRMDMYTHVIIDEVHERDKDTDFALLVVKKLLKTNSRRVKVILMSATIDTSMFAKYFMLTPKGDPAPILDVFGKSKDVSEHYLDELTALGIMIPIQDPYVPSIPEPLYDIVVRLMFFFDKIEKSEQNIPMDEDYAPSRGAVLIFLPGYEEITSMSNKLRASAFNRKFWILPLHSTITLEEQTRVFRDPPNEYRKVIISTNIAESSITVPDIRYVIDFCLTKSLVCDPETNYTCLQLEWASKANCTQRKGRAGRVEIGRVYRMVEKKFYDHHLPDYGIPEMQRCPLTGTVLQLKQLDFGPPESLLALALEPPCLSDIENAMLQLKEALAISVKPGDRLYEGDMTFIGKVMAKLPLDVKISKLIMYGFLFGLFEDTVIIAASLSLKNFFAKPFQKLLDAYKSRLSWADGTFSDCLCYLYAYKAWKKLSVQGFFRRPGGPKEKDWGEQHFVQIKRIKEVDMLVKELKSRLERFDMKEYGSRDYKDEQKDVLILKMVIAAAFHPNYYLQDEAQDEKIVLRETSDNDPLSTVIVSGLPSNQGLLYATSIRDKLSCCGTRMHIDFEEKKAYIQFDQQNEDMCNVLPAVYLAVKMRQLRMPLELEAYSHEEAERKMEQLRKLRDADFKGDNRLRSNRFSIEFNKTNLKQVPLPPTQITTIKIFITYVESCGLFWARYYDEKTSNNLKYLDGTINLHQGKNLMPLDGPPERDMLVLAPFCDVRGGTTMYYRAQVQEVGRQRAKVYFIDYGNTEDVSIGDLRAVGENTPEVLNTPAMAFKCSLAEVKPSLARNFSDHWSDQANRWFKNKVSGVDLTCQIYSVIQNVVRLKPHLTNRENIFESIIVKMIDLKFAEPAEESSASKLNHELRMRVNTYTSTNYDMGSTSSMHFSSEDLGDLRTTNKNIRLHGPSNPLEVNYRGMTYIDTPKMVKVERDSVNSVSFNTGSRDFSTMLVAGYVSLGQSDNLCARSTTLMPKIRGLPSLICLLFSPYSEFRCDRERQNITGALCGLGYDPDTGDPLYPDHDIELDFDVEINKDDISDINYIRLFVNYLYGQENGLASINENAIKKIQENSRSTLYKLLEKNRKPRPTQNYFDKRYRWRQISPEFVETPEVLEGDAKFESLLPCLDVIHLKKSEQEQLQQHFKELVDKAGIGKSYELIRCKFCSEDLTSRHALLLHLASDEHLSNEDRLLQRKQKQF